MYTKTWCTCSSLFYRACKSRDLLTKKWISDQSVGWNVSPPQSLTGKHRPLPTPPPPPPYTPLKFNLVTWPRSLMFIICCNNFKVNLFNWESQIHWRERHVLVYLIWESCQMFASTCGHFFVEKVSRLVESWSPYFLCLVKSTLSGL